MTVSSLAAIVPPAQWTKVHHAVVSGLGARRRNAPRAMRRVQLRGGARWPHAMRSLARGVRGHVWAPQTKIRRLDNLAHCVARRLRAPTKQMGSYHRSRGGR